MSGASSFVGLHLSGMSGASSFVGLHLSGMSGASGFVGSEGLHSSGHGSLSEIIGLEVSSSSGSKSSHLLGVSSTFSGSGLTGSDALEMGGSEGLHLSGMGGLTGSDTLEMGGSTGSNSGKVGTSSSGGSSFTLASLSDSEGLEEGSFSEGEGSSLLGSNLGEMGSSLGGGSFSSSLGLEDGGHSSLVSKLSGSDGSHLLGMSNSLEVFSTFLGSKGFGLGDSDSLHASSMGGLGLSDSDGSSSGEGLSSSDLSLSNVMLVTESGGRLLTNVMSFVEALPVVPLVRSSPEGSAVFVASVVRLTFVPELVVHFTTGSGNPSAFFLLVVETNPGGMRGVSGGSLDLVHLVTELRLSEVTSPSLAGTTSLGPVKLVCEVLEDSTTSLGKKFSNSLVMESSGMSSSLFSVDLCNGLLAHGGSSVFAWSVVPHTVRSDKGAVFVTPKSTGVVRLTMAPSLIESARVVTPPPLFFASLIVETDPELLAVADGVDVMEIAEGLDVSEFHSLSYASEASLSLSKFPGVVLEDSSSVVSLAERGHLVGATDIVPFLVSSEMNAVFVSVVVGLAVAPSSVGELTSVNVLPVAFTMLIVNTDPDVVLRATSEVVDSVDVVDVVNSGEVHAPFVTLHLSLVLGKMSSIEPVVLLPVGSSNADDSSHSRTLDEHLFILKY
jgi:hypothetical protein